MEKILKHGGQRKNATGKKSPMVNLVVPEEMLVKIEDMAWSNRITKSEAIRQLIARGLKNA
tara:strand:- start:1429 stop:1611 length:183 start_codon:yes stop_codon:yes gene_type:complete